MKEYFDNKNIIHKTGSPHNHQTSGAVERVIQTFASKIKKLSNFGKTDYREQIANAALACNLSYNRSI